MMDRLRPNEFATSVLLATLLTAFAGTSVAEVLNDYGWQRMGLHPDTVLPMLKATSGLEHPDSQAAPQILGVVASHGPIPLNCIGDGCRADISTFCLQRARENPGRGQTYMPAEGADITLRGTDRMGREVRLPATPYLEFATDRGFTATEVTLPHEKLEELGLSDIAIEIGEKVSLLPVIAANGSNPQSADEIAAATGTFRENGARYFDETGETGDAIRLANQMINALPARGDSIDDTDGTVLEAAMASDAGKASSIEGIAALREMHAACREKVRVSHHFGSMRSCLESAHDQLVAATNVSFWNSMAGY
jgi:hypothetical protein